MTKLSILVLSLSLLLVWGCSEPSSDGLRTAQQAISEKDALEFAQKFGFEKPGDWTVSQGTKGQSIVHTEGNFSLSVTGSGWTTVTSAELPSLQFDEVGEYMGVDFFHLSDGWGGEVILSVTGNPTWGEHVVGRKNLSELPQDSWHSLRFAVDEATRTYISSQEGFHVRLTYNGGQDTFHFDRFEMDLPEPTPEPGEGGSGEPAEAEGNESILGFEAVDFADRGAFRNAVGEYSAPSTIPGFTVVGTASEGKSALEVVVPGEDRTTVSFVTPQLTDLADPGDVLGVDILMPSQQEGTDFGYLKVFVSSNELGLFNSWVGQARLNGFFTAGGFRRAQIPIPGAIQSKLAMVGYDDLEFRFELSDVPPGNYYFDWLALREQYPPVLPPAPSLDIDEILSFENLGGWKITGTSAQIGGPILPLGELSDEDRDGTYSLCLASFKTAELKSHNLSSLSSAHDALSLSVQMPTELEDANPNWTLGINAFVSVPSQGVWKTSLGYHQLKAANVTVGDFGDVEFPISAELQSILESASYGDLVVEFQLTLSDPIQSCILFDDVDLGQKRFADAILDDVEVRHFDVELPPGASFQNTALYQGRLSSRYLSGAAVYRESSLLLPDGGPAALIYTGGASFGNFEPSSSIEGPSICCR